MNRFWIAAVLASLLAGSTVRMASGAEAIGETMDVARSATAEASGARRDLAIGSSVSARETISTDKVGKAVFRFVDDTQLSVGPGSNIRLDSFVFNDETSPSSFVIRATKGAFRFATGRGDHDAYRIQTPVATVGVRGTQFAVTIAKDQVRVSVTDGAVVLCPYGGRQNFADCVEANVGESIVSGRNSARVVPTSSLPQQRADLLPLRNVANAARAVPGAARGALNDGRALGQRALGTVGDPREGVGRTIGGATDRGEPLERTVRDNLDDPAGLPVPAAGSGGGTSIGGSAGRATAAAGGALGNASPVDAINSPGGVTGGLGGSIGGAGGFGGRAVGGAIGGAGGALGGLGAGLGRR